MGIGRPTINISSRHTRRGSSRRVYRGSRKRLERLNWYRQSSVEFWLFVTFVLLLLFVGVPWMINHPDDAHGPISSSTASPHP